MEEDEEFILGVRLDENVFEVINPYENDRIYESIHKTIEVINPKQSYQYQITKEI